MTTNDEQQRLNEYYEFVIYLHNQQAAGAPSNIQHSLILDDKDLAEQSYNDALGRSCIEARSRTRRR